MLLSMAAFPFAVGVVLLIPALVLLWTGFREEPSVSRKIELVSAYGSSLAVWGFWGSIAFGLVLFAGLGGATLQSILGIAVYTLLGVGLQLRPEFFLRFGFANMLETIEGITGQSGSLGYAGWAMTLLGLYAEAMAVVVLLRLVSVLGP